MEKIKCLNCLYDGQQKYCFNFDSPDLERIEKGELIIPRFRIKCVCGDCGKYIKFVTFKGNLKELNNKFIII